MYSKQASGMLQNLGLGDESKIPHRKPTYTGRIQEIIVISQRIYTNWINVENIIQARSYYSKQASGMLQHLGLGDESKILDRHWKQESVVCRPMSGRRKQDDPLPPPYDSLKLKLIKELNVLYIGITHRLLWHVVWFTVTKAKSKLKLLIKNLCYFLNYRKTKSPHYKQHENTAITNIYIKYRLPLR